MFYAVLGAIMLVAGTGCCDKGQKAGKVVTYPFALNIASAEFGHVIPGVYDKHYIYPGVEDLDYALGKGFELVRVPFKWERLQGALDGPLKDPDLADLKRFVQQAADRGIQVILDLHNYGRYALDGSHELIGTHGIEIWHLADFWQKIAVEFRDFPNIYGYALMNEPHDMSPETPWKSIAQAAIYAIREVDPRLPSSSAVTAGARPNAGWRRWTNSLPNLSRNNINGAYWAAGPWWPDDHFMAVKPVGGQDRPQMKVLEKYLWTEPK